MNLFSLLIDLLEKALIMLRSAFAIAGIIGLAAISYRLHRHYLTSSKSRIHKTKFKDEKRNKAGCTESEAMMSNSNSINVLDDLFNTRINLLQEKHCYGRLAVEFQSKMSNSNAFDALEWRKPILGNLMEALADANTHLIGVYGSDDEIKETLLEKVYRRVQRDKMFGMVVRASITKYPDMRKIPENIATQLGLTFNQKSKDKRALELIHRIKNEQSILIVLGDLCKGFELSKVGIPYGADHRGCKVLLTSTSEDVLSTHMHTQKNFMV